MLGSRGWGWGGHEPQVHLPFSWGCGLMMTKLSEGMGSCGELVGPGSRV